MFNDQRTSYRVKEELPVRVFNRTGEVADTWALEISSGGLKLLADDQLITHMQLEDSSGNIQFPDQFKIELTLGSESSSQPLAIQCRQVYKRRLSQHLYHIGVLILDCQDDGVQAIESYVNERLCLKSA